MEYQSKMGDPENEKKLKKQIRKYKALLEDTQEQLENEREKRSNASVVKSLKNQLEEVQASEATALKNYKWLQGDMDEMQGRYDDLVREKSEVREGGGREGGRGGEGRGGREREYLVKEDEKSRQAKRSTHSTALLVAGVQGE